MFYLESDTLVYVVAEWPLSTDPGTFISEGSNATNPNTSSWLLLGHFDYDKVFCNINKMREENNKRD